MIPQEIIDHYEIAKNSLTPPNRQLPVWDLLFEFYDAYHTPAVRDNSLVQYLNVLQFIKAKIDEQP